MQPSRPSGAGRQELTSAAFREIQKLARSAFGLDLRPGKETLVAARLSTRLRELGMRDALQYVDYIKADRNGAELSVLIDALTTNFTSFLREPQHFRLLQQHILPELGGSEPIRIWSAGCATGEEPYSILFACAEAMRDEAAARVQILASDISTRVLKSATSGIFPERCLQEMPVEWGRRYFQRGSGARAGLVRVKPEWRSRVQFRQINLTEDFSDIKSYSVIFCRNVMIYFDKETQQRLVRRFTESLEPGGWLLIGHSEGLRSIHHELQYVMPAVYRKK